MRLLFLLMLSAFTATAQQPTPFNHARTRCYYGGLSFSADGRTLYHTHVFQKDTLSAIAGKIAITTWANNAWSEPVFTQFTNGNESYPVIDNNRLYFTSDASLPGRTDTRDQNIWYVERNSSGGWTTAAPADALNSQQNDRLAFIDSERNFYVITNSNNHYDIALLKQTVSGWSDPEPMEALNSPNDEEYISVYPSLGVAFIQQSNGRTTEIMMSKLTQGSWTTPVPLNYDQKSIQLPYVQRWPQLSPDLSTFYMVNHGVIWQQPSKGILANNEITIDRKVAYRPLTAKALASNEPELIGGMLLKTNNGISFTPDGKTIYLSQYSNERDSAGRRYIKIFASDLRGKVWSTPQPASFNKAGVPFEYHPVVSADGNKIFYNSRAPLPGSGRKYELKNNVWCVEKNGASWGEPRLLQNLVTNDYDDYASPAGDGTLYFRSDRPGGAGGGDIYTSAFRNGEYQSPELFKEMNSSMNENDLCIDPRKRFIIFNRYYELGQTNNIKLYVSIRTKDGWSRPRALTQLEKSYDYELTPTLSPDGKYFYYEVNSNIMRVETRSLFLGQEWKVIAGEK